MVLSRRENLCLIHKNVVRLIHDGGQLFTGLATSLADTTTILHGTVPKDTLTSDVQTILHLRAGFQFIERYHGPVSVGMIQHVNQIVAYDALKPGQFTQQPMGINGIHYQPPRPSKQAAQKIINDCRHESTSPAIQAIHLMLRYDRRQFFWDGNKRTAWLTANYYLLRHGAGVLNITSRQGKIWNRLLSRYYETGNLTQITRWLNQNCVTADLGSY